MDIAFEASEGDALLLSNNAYELVGPTLGYPTNDPGDPEHSSIVGVTHNIADPQGKTVYTPGERSLAYYEFGTQGGTVGVPDEPYWTHLILMNRNPLATDDTTLNYRAGTYWINTNLSTVYICADSTEAAAVWTLRSSKTGISTAGGVFRLWGHPFVGWTISGIEQGNITGGVEADAQATNLMTGDYIETRQINFTGTNYIYFSFLPWTH